MAGGESESECSPPQMFRLLFTLHYYFILIDLFCSSTLKKHTTFEHAEKA